MIAAVLKLSRSDCQALKITDAYSIHRVIYSLFPGDKRDFLFADKGGDYNSRRILILAERQPVAPQYGTIEVKKIPADFLDHDLYGFEVILNATKKDCKTGKTVPITGRENLHQWFIKKAPTLGFEIVQGSLEVRKTGVQSMDIGEGKKITHNIASFIGRAKVIDKIIFQESFNKGIGRAKGFGFGLFQIVPLKNQ
jgi:CRISPR system Cascade subunit CasE